jgi:hypothetical protein
VGGWLTHGTDDKYEGDTATQKDDPMTRTERAAAKVQKEKEKAAELERVLKERLSEQREETRKAEATLREETRKADNRRRYHVGTLAQEAGLFVWSNSDFQAVFAVLARLADTPHPAALLEGLLGGNGVSVHEGDEFLTEKLLSRFPNAPPPERENAPSPPPRLAGV